MSSSSPKQEFNRRLNPDKAKVIVGMSGGVDSSVAAHLLIQEGFEVEGLFMKNWDEDDGTDYCTAIADLADAQQVCERLDIPLHTANFAAEYWDNVFSHFLHEYQNWRTPNPDILCNREIKFEQFVRYAETLGADYIATGHYVRRSTPTEHHEQQSDSLRILKGVDSNKDQTYFLQAVPKQKLARCLFPLGDWHKQDIRQVAQSLGLANHRKKDSTGICFIGERRFADFLGQYINDQPGPITDRQGRILGQHRGLHQYTIGQRQGINLGGVSGRAEQPWYVLAKQPHHNTLLVTQDEDRPVGDLAAHQRRQLAGIRRPPLRLQGKDSLSPTRPVLYRAAGPQMAPYWCASSNRNERLPPDSTLHSIGATNCSVVAAFSPPMTPVNNQPKPLIPNF
jgi:tRNA-specific 2-thiouridylase